MDEAQALLLLRHVPRAYALGILAAEEYGKHMMAFGAAGRAAGDLPFWKDFWKRFYSHSPKLDNAMGARLLPQAELARFEEEVERHLDRKMAGFYVDFSDGVATAPIDAIDPVETTDMLGAFARLIGWSVSAWADHDFVAVFEESAAPASLIQAAMASGDLAKVDAAWRTTTGHGMPEHLTEAWRSGRAPNSE